ncbi:hypothetical protein DFH08DRAFT_823155 [Mycena albidolilacea]|uniref:Uncharacterized protein n=1 Tax=Mycena albidolilacea TaxID=1033008 RepID=A0AAD6Z735_9AGAR|nr:hypothetical protein DFH08DRAFT_823155 [Mycena albidolilacea]
MARLTKAKKSKCENVSKASMAHRKTSQLGNPAISSDTLATENSSSSTRETTSGSYEFQEGSRNDSEREWDVALGEELPDIECTELQDIRDEEDVEVATEFALGSFTKFLADAQVAAQKLERCCEWESSRKRKRGTYKGTSKQTLWCNDNTAERLKAKGFTSINTFFKPKAPVESSSCAREEPAALEEVQVMDLVKGEEGGSGSEDETSEDDEAEK